MSIIQFTPEDGTR